MSRRDSTARKAGSQKRGSPSAGDVYRKAARLLEEDVYAGSPYACDRIGQAAGWYGVKHAPMSARALFAQLRNDFAAYYEQDGQIIWFGEDSESNRGARILALCFMAAIADSEK